MTVIFTYKLHIFPCLSQTQSRIAAPAPGTMYRRAARFVLVPEAVGSWRHWNRIWSTTDFWWKKSCTSWDVKNLVNNGYTYQLVQDFFHQRQWPVCNSGYTKCRLFAQTFPRPAMRSTAPFICASSEVPTCQSWLKGLTTREATLKNMLAGMSNQPNFASRLASTWIPKNQPTWNRLSVVLNDHVLEMLISLGPVHQIMRKNLCYLHITSVNARAHTDVKSQCHAPFNHAVIFSCFQKATFYRNMLWNVGLCQQVKKKWIWVNLPIRSKHWTRTMNTPTSLMYCGLRGDNKIESSL